MSRNPTMYIAPNASTNHGERHKRTGQSLFKGLLDVILYLVSFGVLPLYSIYTGLATVNPSILFTALGCCICVIYDCYSRWDNREGLFDTVALLLLGFIYFCLLTYTAFLIANKLDQNAMGPIWPFWFLFASPGFGIVKFFQILPEYIR